MVYKVDFLNLHLSNITTQNVIKNIVENFNQVNHDIIINLSFA